MTSTVDVVPLMKTAGVVKNSGHCIYSIRIKVFLKFPFAVYFCVLYIYISIYDTKYTHIIYIYMYIYVIISIINDIYNTYVTHFIYITLDTHIYIKWEGQWGRPRQWAVKWRELGTSKAMSSIEKGTGDVQGNELSREGHWGRPRQWAL